MENRQAEESEASGSEVIQPQLPLAGGSRAIPKILSLPWWRAVAIFVFEFRRYSFKPGALLAIGLLLYLVGTYYVWNSLAGGNRVFTTADVMQTAVGGLVILLVSTVGSIGSITFSLALWFYVLSVFCRAFLSIDPERATLDDIKSAQNEAHLHFASNRRKLLSAWLVYSILMTLPGTGVFLAAVLPMIGYYCDRLGLGFSPPPSVSTFVLALGGISLVFLVNHALLLFAYSGVSAKAGRGIATESLLASLKTLPLLTAVTVVSVAGGAVFMGLVDILVARHPEFFTDQAATYIWMLVACAWHGVSSMIILPLSLVIPCEMVRGSIE